MADAAPPAAAWRWIGAARRLARAEILMALALAAFQTILMARLSAGDFFNSFAYISDDGFDWITQGVAFNQLVSGEDATPWPVLRLPGFVMVSALDDAFGALGLVFFLAQGLAVGLTAWMIGRYGRAKGFGAWPIAAVLAAWYFSIFGFWRLWVLSDTLASALMTASVVLLLAGLEKEARATPAAEARRLAPAAAVAVLAGLTQTYGIIPFLVICTLYAAGRLVARRDIRAATAPAAAMIAVAAATFGLQKLWAAFIPHASQPSQFGLLKLTLDMAPFYANVWTLAFAALAPAVLVAAVAKWRARALPTIEEIALIASVGAFAVMTLLYQWTESRFTFLYLPLAWLAIIAWCAPGERRGEPAARVGRAPARALLACAVLSALAGLGLVPGGDYWRPHVVGARLAPGASWLAGALADDPVDRFSLSTRCASLADFCEQAEAEPQASPYRNTMFAEYKRRILADRKRAARKDEPGTGAGNDGH